MTPERIAWALLSVVTLILSVAVHEFAHAFAAHKLGDDLPEQEGRLTLNPLAHVDPIGTLAVPLLGALIGGVSFGWGRPVSTVPMRYTRKLSMRAGEALVAFAGPFANLIMGLACTLILVVLLRLNESDLPEAMRSYLTADAVHLFLQNMAVLNFALFLLNLIPFPPLDGAKIAAWVFGQAADSALEWMSSLSFIGLFVVIFVAGAGIGKAAATAFVVIIGHLR